MSDDESPPPYSCVVANPLVNLPVPPFNESEVALPFSYSDHLAAQIKALVSAGNTLDSRFKDVRDVASAEAMFEYQEHALVLSQRFETLVWESRNIASIALVAIKDFNEVVLDFLSEPDVVVQDRLKELANSSKLLQRERDSVKNQKASFDTLVKESEDYHQMIYSELGALIPKRRRQSQSGGQGSKVTRPPLRLGPLFGAPFSEPMCTLSTVTASLGAISRTCMDYALQFERLAEQVVFSYADSSPGAPMQDINLGHAPSHPSERKRTRPCTERAEPAALPGLVDTLVCDLRPFAARLDVFDTVFAELARAQDIFIVYLKDGQSIASQGYRFEINRLRRQLPCLCSALDAYSKARLS